MHALWPRVQALHPQLWRAVCGYELNHAVREELLQEVLLAIWESLPTLREPDRLLPFVLRIAHNLGASHVRSETRVPTPVPFDEAVHDVPAPAAAAGCARTQWLVQALASLPLNLRQVQMLQLEGFDYQEIAQMLGISPENVGVRLHRARERLKALSRQEDDDGL
jgi:RNA polymerase sigma factor (sigma-70 family)